MVPRHPTDGPSGSYRNQSPQSRRAPSLARDPATASANLERRTGLGGKPQSASASSGSLRRLPELSGAGAAAEENNGAHTRVCAVPAGVRDQLARRERRQTRRVTAVTSKSVGRSEERRGGKECR